MPETQTPAWEPTKEQIAETQMFQFLESINDSQELALKSYQELFDWSIENSEVFWEQVWKFCKVKASQQPTCVLQDKDKMPGAKWFPDAKLNFAENLLRHQNDKEAIVFWNETGRKKALTYNELYLQVAATAAALKASGVGVGDRVAAFIPNIPEAIIGMLATTSLGAIWSSSSPDFETKGVLDRFGQIEPKVLFCADGYLFKTKEFHSLDRITEIEDKLPSLRKIVVVPYLEDTPDISCLKKGELLPDFLKSAKEQRDIQFEQLPANHPVYIMFSSGTTGAPKCMVHGAVGTLLEHLKEHILHTNVTEDEKVFYATTCGWMMWNWLVSGLATGATVLIYDGFPFAREGHVLFDMAEQEKISIFGTSAGFISAAEKFKLRPKETHDLSALHTILSTGSPLVEENFDYIYSTVKTDLKLCSITGGTDIIGCFALGNPMQPVYRGWLQCKSLGLDVDVWNDEQESLINTTGELVCKAPFPSMPVEFWNDPDGSLYNSAYFSRFSGIWWHGDYAVQNEQGCMKILGRSDATLNPGGVRIGTAEIYRAVERIPEILDSAVVGQSFQGDERVILFVIMQPGHELTEDLIARIKNEMPSPRHRPAKVLEVLGIPTTRSGKKSEIAIKKLIHGEEPKNIGALANPDSLNEFRDRPELSD